MKKIIITGCNGQLGRALNLQMQGRQDMELVNTDVGELDITSIDKVLAFVREMNPYAIINCAAHTNVNACETDEDNAYRINALGPRNLSIAARETGAKVMHISTDYVFDGFSDKPYREHDSVNPQGVYGRTKLEGERYVKDFAEKYFILRTAWLYGDGNNFAKTMLKLSESNDTVRVVGDQFGTPTSAAELARAVDYMIDSDNYGIFHATCEGECSWADFAKEIYRLAGLSTKVDVITTKEYPTPAARPQYSVLENYMLNITTDFRFAPWQDAIVEYMK